MSHFFPFSKILKKKKIGVKFTQGILNNVILSRCAFRDISFFKPYIVFFSFVLSICSYLLFLDPYDGQYNNDIQDDMAEHEFTVDEWQAQCWLLIDSYFADKGQIKFKAKSRK